MFATDDHIRRRIGGYKPFLLPGTCANYKPVGVGAGGRRGRDYLLVQYLTTSILVDLDLLASSTRSS